MTNVALHNIKSLQAKADKAYKLTFVVCGQRADSAEEPLVQEL